jgi:FkbM family methyltransferase
MAVSCHDLHAWLYHRLVKMDRSDRQRGALTRRVLELGLLGDRQLFVLDVGCSGGIEDRWTIFGNRLRAVGFDPLVSEIERLARNNTHDGVTYEAAFVTCGNYDQLFPPELRNDRIASRNNDPFSRVSAAAAMRRMQTPYVQQVFNAGAPVVLADRSITLDEFVGDDESAHVDFVKIDTDGHDIEVILGAEGLMNAGGVIGLRVEVQFHGPTHDAANTFSNIDRVLRRHGFTLFDLEAYRYSRTELPAPFVYDLAAQTTSGQIMWGEALYCRDLAAAEYERMWRYEITPDRVMRLACFFDLFKLPDCAAELLLNRGSFLNRAIRDELLDVLASGEPGSYAAHVAAFDRDFTSFYRSRMQTRGNSVEMPSASAAAAVESEAPARLQSGAAGCGAHADVLNELRERISKLTAKNTSLRERLRVRDRRLARLTKRFEGLSDKRRA